MKAEQKITYLDGPPWSRVQSFIHSSYELTDEGVTFIRETKDNRFEEFIAGPCWVHALTRSSQGTEWGYEIGWIDQDGQEQRMAFPARKLSEPRSPLAADLASLGLKVIPGKERKLMAYLASFNLPPEFRLRSVSQLGWMGEETAGPLFVLPDGTVSLQNDEDVVFQPEEHSPTLRTMHQSGTLKQWQTFVAKPCQGNHILLFSLCTAFAGSLLKFAGLDSGGFHFYGLSSKGKTTALQVAASVWGCGGDPAVSEHSYIGRWNTTGNALEATAAAHNDGLLTLDEMGTCDSKDFGKVVYDLFGGKGKSRLNKNSTLQAQRTWRILGLSTGEISVRQKIEEDSGRQAKAGQLVRLADIPITAGVIIDTHGLSANEFVNRLKKACNHSYGSAGAEFLRQLVQMEPESSLLRQAIQTEVDQRELDLSHGRELETYQRRVLRRLSTVMVAGVLATRFNIIPCTEEDVAQAVATVRDAWLGDDGNKPEAVRGVEALKEFILRNPGRFRRIIENGGYRHLDLNIPSREIVGYSDGCEKEGGYYLLTPSGFAEACCGHSREGVLGELRARDYLDRDRGRNTKKWDVPGYNRPRVYAIKKAILDYPDDGADDVYCPT